MAAAHLLHSRTLAALGDAAAAGRYSALSASACAGPAADGACAAGALLAGFGLLRFLLDACGLLHLLAAPVVLRVSALPAGLPAVGRPPA